MNSVTWACFLWNSAVYQWKWEVLTGFIPPLLGLTDWLQWRTVVRRKGRHSYLPWNLRPWGWFAGSHPGAQQRASVGLDYSRVGCNTHPDCRDVKICKTVCVEIEELGNWNPQILICKKVTLKFICFNSILAVRLTDWSLSMLERHALSKYVLEKHGWKKKKPNLIL